MQMLNEDRMSNVQQGMFNDEVGSETNFRL
jgi:hypothetical protein